MSPVSHCALFMIFITYVIKIVRHSKGLIPCYVIYEDNCAFWKKMKFGFANPTHFFPQIVFLASTYANLLQCFWVKREATQHGWLPSLLGDGNKGIVKLYGEEKNILCCARWSSQFRAKISSTGTTSPMKPKIHYQPRKDPFHLYSLSPHSPQFQPGFTVSRGHPSLVSLKKTL